MSLPIYSRYYGLATVVVNGQPSLAERPLPNIVDYPDAIVHQVVTGDTLDQLAKTYYGREDLWWRIADANPRKDPFDWAVGDNLIIPPPRAATQTPAR